MRHWPQEDVVLYAVALKELVFDAQTGLARDAKDGRWNKRAWLRRSKRIIDFRHHRTPCGKRGTCRICACTDQDCRHCEKLHGKPCGWANHERTLCTSCHRIVAPLFYVEGGGLWK